MHNHKWTELYEEHKMGTKEPTCWFEPALVPMPLQYQEWWLGSMRPAYGLIWKPERYNSL